MLKLFVQNTESVDPVVFIRWCIDIDTIAELKQKKAGKPYLLLSYIKKSPSDNKHHDECFKDMESRKLIPFEQEMDSLVFYGAGDYRIFATIVWGSYVDEYGKRISSEKTFLARDRYGYYKERLWDGYGQIYYFFNDPNRIELAEIDINVSEKHFAKEPAEWEKKWVNLFFSTLPTNQCHLRKRRILAYLIQPAIIVLWFAVSFLVFSFLWLFWFLGAGKILNFFKFYGGWPTTDILSGFEFALSKKEGPSLICSRIWWPFTPFLICLGGGALFSTISHIDFDLLFLVWFGVWTLQIILFLFSVNLFIQYVFFPIMNRFIGKRFSKKEKGDCQSKIPIFDFDKELTALVCQGKPAIPKISELPKKRQTLYLQYLDLKSKVCKPYSR